MEGSIPPHTNKEQKILFLIIKNIKILQQQHTKKKKIDRKRRQKKEKKDNDNTKSFYYYNILVFFLQGQPIKLIIITRRQIGTVRVAAANTSLFCK